MLSETMTPYDSVASWRQPVKPHCNQGATVTEKSIESEGRLNIRIDERIKRQFKALSATEGVTISNLFERMFQEYLDRHYQPQRCETAQ